LRIIVMASEQQVYAAIVLNGYKTTPVSQLILDRLLDPALTIVRDSERLERVSGETDSPE